MSRAITVRQILDKRFEIIALIEHSGMATILKAQDCESGQLVVLKVPHAEFEASPGSFSRFGREAATLGKLDHPGIPKLIPVTEKSRPYVAMEFIPGPTLYEILEKNRSLPEAESLRLAGGLCDILEYLHRQNIVHCDVKPGNIIVSDDGRPHLIDFGIATEPAWFSAKFGTAEYMAPEQVHGDRVDARTDIYGLGAVLYEMVTGARPAAELRQPRELNPGLSEQAEEIILHAMAPDAADRYPSASAMKADLDAPEAVRVTGRYRNRRKANPWPKRLRLAAFVVGLAAVPIILFFIFLLIIQRQVPR